MLKESRIPRALWIIVASSFMLNLAFGLNRSIFSNFTGQELGIGYSDFGILEGIREVPGLLTIVLVALASRMQDSRLYAFSGSLIGIGIWLYSGANSYSDLIVATLIYSTGFHMWSVVQDSLVMKSVSAADRAGRLGQINSVAAAATLLGMGLVSLISGTTGLRPIFVMAGVLGLGGALIALFMPAERDRIRPPAFVFRWEYRSYYILTLLQGARRHVVLTFASFALVKLYGTSAQTMALLLAAHSFLAIWTRPMIGRIIDRVGEQKALSLNYAVVAIVFAGYAFLRLPWLVYTLFVLDNLLTGFDIAVSTHAARIIPRAELSSSLATGTSINHIFGVAVPVVGGLLWEWFGPVIPFLMGVALVLVAMAYSWKLDSRIAAGSGATESA